MEESVLKTIRKTKHGYLYKRFAENQRVRRERGGRYTVKDLARIVGITISTGHKMLTKELGYRKISARCIYLLY